MLQEGDIAGLAAFCTVVHPAAVAEILDELDRTIRSGRFWIRLTCRSASKSSSTCRCGGRSTLVEQLDHGKDCRSCSNGCPRTIAWTCCPACLQVRREDVLRLIARAERNDIRKLLSYDEDSAGAIMTTEYASLPANISVREALDQLRLQAPNSETIYYVYIISEDRRNWKASFRCAN
jgi:magnesium transporter